MVVACFSSLRCVLFTLVLSMSKIFASLDPNDRVKLFDGLVGGGRGWLWVHQVEIYTCTAIKWQVSDLAQHERDIT